MVDRLAPGLSLGKPAKTRQLMLVGQNILDVVWPQVEHIFLANHGWQEYYTLDHLKEFIRVGQMHLWVVNDNEEFIMAVLTEFVNTPLKRAVRTVWVGGDDLRGGLKLWDIMEHWAWKNGATKSVGFAERKGLLRMLEPYGYKRKAYAFEKDISEIKEH